MNLIKASRAALAGNGDLAKRINGFVHRPAQQALAGAIAEVFDSGQTLVAEAGTGTGKTYAYLVPALLSGRRVIVSTGTRALQDQLYHRDLPRVCEALGVPVRAALLKGRRNYICRYRLERARSDGRFASREQASQLLAIHAWAGRSGSGDIAGIEHLPEDSPLWPQVTSNAENCLGSECPFWSDCFVVKARQAAQAADLVVVNHHLLFADLAIKREGFGEILPGAHAFVLDEAHQLPELAGQFFGDNISARQINDLARDVLAECANVSGALEVVQTPGRQLVQAVRELRLALDPLPNRGAMQRALETPGVAAAFETLEKALEGLAEALTPLAAGSPGFEACAARAKDQKNRLAHARDVGEGNEIRWFEITERGFSCQVTPLDVSEPLREFREKTHAAWIFTSATLAVAGSFKHFSRQVGLDAPATLLEQSPFDYAKQALAYLPRGLPEPASRDYLDALLNAVEPVLAASNGRAFLLFTSHRALRLAAERLAGRCRFPLFVQGSAPRHALLESFRTSGNGILLGAASFWEGVDVAGAALTVVVIDKLPFAAPDDPVLEARLSAIRRQGGNPFLDGQLPAAVIALKQGAGRLIRTQDDRGVLVLCDPRLGSKSYGQVFLDSLPPFPQTRELEDVTRFLCTDRTAPAK